MKYNEGAEIVPGYVLANLLGALPSETTPTAIIPYARVQLLAEDEICALVNAARKRFVLVYGRESQDFPLCKDFSDICRATVKQYADEVGLAVRPAFGELEYTKTTFYTDGPYKGLRHRHAINWAATAGRRILYFEPQIAVWSDAPADIYSLDRFTL